MAELKTKPTRASVADHIASRANPQQRADCRELMALLKQITGKPPKMWGPSIIGYGSQPYRNGKMPLAAFAIRGRDIVIYLYAESAKQKSLLSKVGKHSMGKSCFYFRQLADLDRSTLKRLVVGSIAEFKALHG